MKPNLEKIDKIFTVFHSFQKMIFFNHFYACKFRLSSSDRTIFKNEIHSFFKNVGMRYKKKYYFLNCQLIHILQMFTDRKIKITISFRV